MKYEFTLVFAIDRCTESVDEIVDLLGAAGLTDALVGLGRPGHVALLFSRVALARDIAIQAAIAAVANAVPMAELVELHHWGAANQ
jgi:hypothetical protein